MGSLILTGAAHGSPVKDNLVPSLRDGILSRLAKIPWCLLNPWQPFPHKE